MDVAVLEPRELLRQGLAAVLERLDVVGGLECHGTIGELLVVCQARGHDWNPDVVIVSGAPDMQVVERVRSRFPASLVLELVASDEHRDLMMAAKTHANGYLMLHETTEATLDRTLHALMRGELTMPQPVADYLFECARSAEVSSPRRHPYFNASERAVIDLLLEGLSNRQIAQKLSISLHSAKRLVSSVLQKSNSPSRAHFAAHMLRDDTNAL